MNAEAAEEYTQSLGQIGSGYWRQVEWAQRNGIPEALGLTTKQWVQERLGGYVKIGIPERRDAVIELSANGYSNVAVGQILGVDETTVRRDKDSANAEVIPQEDSQTADHTADSSANAEPAHNHRALGTGENEWFTPIEYILAAREVMDGIDLDPATHEIAQRDIAASTFYTRATDGLTQPWGGNVWLNPPYEQPLIAKFVKKLVKEWGTRSIKQAILLTHNYTDTTWFQYAARNASLICFTKGRIKFVDVDGGACAPTQGQAFFYFGLRQDRFKEVFNQFGFIR